MVTFSGSYRPDDVTFLLKCLPALPFVDVARKEQLIQSGQRHYSEMLSPEALPSARYLAIFRSACEANREQMARDCLTLATLIAERRSGPITLAGRPELQAEWLPRVARGECITAFALSEPDIIRIQDRELASLPPAVNRGVRMLQRRYVQEWVALVAQLAPATPIAEIEVRVHATFGLLNSTPHNARLADVADARGVLAEMAIVGMLSARTTIDTR